MANLSKGRDAKPPVLTTRIRDSGAAALRVSLSTMRNFAALLISRSTNVMFQRSVFLHQKSYAKLAEASQCLLERTRNVPTYPGIRVLHITLCVFVLGHFLSGTAVAQGDIRFRADFESGSVQDKVSNHDGFRIQTVPINQVGTTVFSSASGCCGPSASLDTRVVSSRKPPNTGRGAATETVLPRNGQYFLESSIHYDKNYTAWNGNGGKDKPRSSIYITVHEFDYDEEGFIGFSISTIINPEVSTARKAYFPSIVTSHTKLLVFNFPDNPGLLTLLISNISIPEGPSAINK